MQSRYIPQRTSSNEIILYLSTKQPFPKQPPVELRNQIQPDVWNLRLPAIIRLAGRYSKPLFERLWTGLAILSSAVVPIVMFHVFANILGADKDINNADDAFNQSTSLFNSTVVDDDHQATDKLFEARWISFGIFIALILVFYVPLGIWKYMGARNVQRMLQGWAREDRAAKGPNAALPLWKVRLPGVWRDDITLTITIPYDAPPSTFHPDAYLPSYINGPADADAIPYLSYGGENGEVPMYGDEKGQGGAFEDLKV